MDDDVDGDVDVVVDPFFCFPFDFTAVLVLDVDVDRCKLVTLFKPDGNDVDWDIVRKDGAGNGKWE